MSRQFGLFRVTDVLAGDWRAEKQWFHSRMCTDISCASDSAEGTSADKHVLIAVQSSAGTGAGRAVVTHFFAPRTHTQSAAGALTSAELHKPSCPQRFREPRSSAAEIRWRRTLLSLRAHEQKASGACSKQPSLWGETQGDWEEDEGRKAAGLRGGLSVRRNESVL